MGIAIGILVGLIINVVLLYLVLSDLFAGKRHLAIAFFYVLALFGVVSFYVYFADGNSDLYIAFGFGPLYFFGILAQMGISRVLSVLISLLVLSLPFIILYTLSRKAEIKSVTVKPRALRFVQLFGLVIAGTFFVLISLASWQFWLSPQNMNSPLLIRYSVDSTPTSFYKDWTGNVYTFLQFGSGDMSYYRRVDLFTKANDFKVLSRHWARSSSTLFYASVKDGKMANVGHLDFATFRHINDYYVSDKEGVYLDAYNKVGGVEHPEQFRPLEAATEIAICWSDNYDCDWYQDDASVYYKGSKLTKANAKTFALTNQSTGYDDTYSYVVDFNKTARADASSCTNLPCIPIIGMSDFSVVSTNTPATKTPMVDLQSCDQDSLYGSPYYIAPNKNVVCYSTYEMNGADTLSFIPLEAVSVDIAQVLLPNVRIRKGYPYSFALDEGSFYVDGDAVYSVVEGSYTLLSAPKPGQDGAVVIKDTQYRLVMTGLVGATLK